MTREYLQKHIESFVQRTIGPMGGHSADCECVVCDGARELMTLIDQYVADELAWILERGHGGGNWRRLIEQRKAKTNEQTKKGGETV